MNNHAYYRSQSKHCADQAASVTDPQLKAAWLKLAADWLALIPSDARKRDDGHAAERLSDAMAALSAPPATKAH